MKFALRFPFIHDREQQANNEALLAAVNRIGLFINSGQGAPTHTPAGPELYFEEDGPGVHIYNGGWVAL